MYDATTQQAAQAAKRERETRTIGFKEMRAAAKLRQVCHREPLPRQLPATRAECADAPRPCPFVTCRHHLYLEINPSGSVTLNFPGYEVWEIPESCALDIAERGDKVTLSTIGSLWGLNRERVRQIEASALRKLPLRAQRELDEMRGLVAMREEETC